jgi:hypothetical protein
MDRQTGDLISLFKFFKESRLKIYTVLFSIFAILHLLIIYQ